MLLRSIYHSKRLITSTRKSLPIQLKCMRPKRLRLPNQIKPKLSISKAASSATIAAYSTSHVIPFEWINGLIGGLCVGASASGYLLVHGRIAGISGIFSKILTHAFTLGKTPAACSHFGFFTGLVSAGIYWNMYYKKQMLSNSENRFIPFQEVKYSPYIMVLGGLLVGLGVIIGSGCSSGHGVCGIARQSLRSITAVGTFMSLGAVTATLSTKYYPSLYNLKDNEIFKMDQLSKLSKYGVPLIAAALLMGSMYTGMKGIGGETLLSLLPSVLCGFGFGSGLVWSGMTKPDKIRDFLNVGTSDFIEHWDPSLVFVFCGALGITMIAFPLITKYMTKPILSNVWHLPTKTMIDKRLMIGSGIFGTGFGLSGFCPGPEIMNLASEEYSSPAWLWFLSCIIGMRLGLLL